MYRKIILIFLSIFSFVYSVDEIEVEKRRQEQQNFEDLIKIQSFNIHKNIEDEDNEEKNLVLNVTSINLEGNTIFENFQVDTILNKYVGKNKNIYALINELENKYIEKGYVTTRVRLNIEKSNFENGKISLFVLEGKIDKVFYDGKENKFKTFITFPKRENNVLSIRDLEQGIDNLGDNSKMDIKASDKNGYSNIDIKREKGKLLSGGINYNNLGQKSTGRYRYKIFLDSHNLVSLNENINFSFQEKIQSRIKDGDNKNYSLGLNIPYKYYSFSYSYENSEYFRTVSGLERKYYATGNTINQSFGVRRVFNRNENHKIDFGINFVLKDSKNYINDILLTTSTRKLSTLTLDISYMGRAALGLLSGNISTTFGLKKFGANIDANEWYREETSPKAQFRKYNFNMSWYRPINNIYYKVNIVGQYSNNILYSQEKIAIGDDTTVRGFKDESLQGDLGFYLRNEIGYKGLKHIEPYIAYDYGYAKNNKIIENYKRRLQGLTLGGRVSYKNFEGSLAISKAIERPSFFGESSVVVYTSLTYKF